MTATTYDKDRLRDSVERVCIRLLLERGFSRQDPSEDRFVLKAILNELVWKLSEATDESRGSKYLRCEKWSEDAYQLYNKQNRSCKGLIFEHVVPRKVIVERLLASEREDSVR